MKKIVSLFSWYEFKSMRYSHFVVFQNTAYGFIGVYSTKCFFLSHLTTYQENKDTLFFFQIEENTVSYFLNMRSNDWDSHSVDLTPINSQAVTSKTSKWLYLSHLTSYQDNKTTSFSSTLIVEENKVLFHLLDATDLTSHISL